MAEPADLVGLGADVRHRGEHHDVRHRGEHHVADGARFVPGPRQRPRIPVWPACTVPHRAPLARAARWDGVILAALTATGGIDPVTPAQVAEARDVVGRHREDAGLPADLAGFDVAVVAPGVPDRDAVAAYDAAGVTWLLVTGWLDDLRPLASAPPPE